MGRELKNVLPAGAGQSRITRALRRRLAATTILAVAPFLGYGRQAYAACVPSSGTIFICSDTSAGENFTGANAVDNADFRTAAQPPFVVTDDGVFIEGDGHIRFTDNNASSIRNTSGTGLDVRSTGNDTSTDPDTPGAVTIFTNGTIRGSTYGIYAKNYGDGDLAITVYGEIEGEGEDGIKAYNETEGNNVAITTGAGSKVTGAEYGIYAEQDGTGDLTLTIYGEVTGTNRDGLEAINSDGQDLKITTGAQSIITGGDHGIYVDNHGYGDAEIAAGGIVRGLGGDGIHASNSSTNDNQKGLTITTTAGSSVTGSDNGLYGSNFGDLDLEITANGLVTGEGEAGIYGENAGEGDMIIKIGASGLVQGNETGIYAKSGFTTHGQDIFITNDGLVRNLSGETDDLAIRTAGGPSTVNNNNLLIGTVEFAEYDDIVHNAGAWNSANGASDFGGGDDVLNNSGTVRAANDPLAGETTTFGDLETFNNSGVVSLVDGEVGDTLEMGPATAFVGQGGRLAVDAVLADGGTADVLIVNGNTSGVTYVAVNATNPASITPNVDGITVVEVNGGVTADGDFDAEGGVINAGFFAWDVRRDGNTHELYTAGLGAGSFEFAAGTTAAQDIWFQTSSTMLQRQADLRPLIANALVTPVADFAEPVEPTPVSNVTPGLWVKGVGAYIQRDRDEDNDVVTDRDQRVYGLMGGFDFGTENLGAQGDALMFGLLGGYIHSDLEFDATNTEWKFEGPSIGVYATYLDRAFYVDAIVKADFLDVDIDADDIAPGAGEADTDVFNIGGQIDTGYKFPLDTSLFVEPQASLVVLHTEIDDIDDIFGGAVDFDDETSVRGRLGLRLGHEQTASNGILYSGDVTAGVWQSFTGDNDVTIFAPLTPASNVSDDPGETFGDVSVGFSVLTPEGWSGFIRANYLFAEDYDAIAGNAGVRYAW